MKKTCTIAAIAITFLAANVATAQTVKDLPAGVVKVSGVVPGLGEHWADPKDLPRNCAMAVKLALLRDCPARIENQIST